MGRCGGEGAGGQQAAAQLESYQQTRGRDVGESEPESSME
jgi:hypothetical protein